MDQTLIEDSRSAIIGRFFYMVSHVFDESNPSQEIFAIDTRRTVICSLGHGRKHMLTILPTISFTDDIIILLNFIFTYLQGYQITPGLSTNKQRHRLLLLKTGTNPSLSNA